MRAGGLLIVLGLVGCDRAISATMGDKTVMVGASASVAQACPKCDGEPKKAATPLVFSILPAYRLQTRGFDWKLQVADLSTAAPSIDAYGLDPSGTTVLTGGGWVCQQEGIEKLEVIGAEQVSIACRHDSGAATKVTTACYARRGEHSRADLTIGSGPGAKVLYLSCSYN
jgi:hypothetical protein